MKLELAHCDTCLPDYWGGHHMAHIQAPVWRGMTPKQLRQELRNELSHGCVMGSDEIARILSFQVPATNEKKERAAWRAARAAVNRVRPAKKGARRLFLHLDEVDPDDDGAGIVYAFFIIREVAA